MPISARKVVAIGGGTGLPLVLRAVRTLGVESPTAVVTMADDGGSSGRLRREIGILPPGDVRNCLVALADPSERLLADLFGYRFPEGNGLAGHALGNLFLAALTDLSGGFEDAVDLAARHLKVHGEVLPSTLDDVVLHALDEDGSEIWGQASVANNDVAIFTVAMSPTAHANPRAVAAILEADVVLIGPGSLYTSLIPNFLIPGILEALRETDATVVYIANVANARGETTGFDAYDHVSALNRHGLKGLIDVVLCPEGSMCPGGQAGECAQRISASGMAVVVCDLVDDLSPVRHDGSKLVDALRGVL